MIGTPLSRDDMHKVEVLNVQDAVKPCPKPKYKRRKGTKYIPPRTRVKRALYALVAKIVKWRDAECVQKNQGGCYGAATDGHILVRDEYGTTFDLLNNHNQCQGHNNQHRFKPRFYYKWFQDTFGMDAWNHLCDEANKVQTEKSIPTQELEELLVKYRGLWDNRPAVYTRDDLIRLGYFGDWLKFEIAYGQKEG